MTARLGERSPLCKGKGGKLGASAMKRVAAGDYLPTPWLFEPAKCSDDIADYCPGYSSVHSSADTRYSFLQLSGLGRALWANGDEGSAQ